MSYSDLPHLRSNAASIARAAKPTVAVGAGAGTGATASLTNGTDQHGAVSVTTGSAGWAAGTLATVTFATPYTVAPYAVSVDAGDANSTKLFLYATVTNTALTLSVATPATGASQVFVIYYTLFGGA